jgi:regulator of sigma E protease
MQKDEEIAAPFTEGESYSARGPSQRLFTVAMGPLFNIVLAWVIYWGLMIGGTGLLLPEVGRVNPESPAAVAGIQPGDMFTSINGTGITYWEDVLFSVQRSRGKTVDVKVDRHGQNYTFNITPDSITFEDDQGRERTIYLMGVIASGRYMQKGFFEAGINSFKAAWSKTLLIANLVKQLFTRENSVTENLGGPVMIAQTVHNQAANSGLVGVLKLTALLSINLALLNLLPIPALDGGHIMFNTIELIFRRPVPESVQVYFTYCGIIFLIGLMLLATALDIFRLVG